MTVNIFYSVKDLEKCINDQRKIDLASERDFFENARKIYADKKIEFENEFSEEMENADLFLRSIECNILDNEALLDEVRLILEDAEYTGKLTNHRMTFDNFSGNYKGKFKPSVRGLPILDAPGRVISLFPGIEMPFFYLTRVDNLNAPFLRYWMPEAKPGVNGDIISSMGIPEEAVLNCIVEIQTEMQNPYCRFWDNKEMQEIRRQYSGAVDSLIIEDALVSTIANYHNYSLKN